MNKMRDIPIDIVRGLAIFLMIAANMSVISHGDPAWSFRFTSSLAAPIFITLVGMMVALGATKGVTFRSYLKKGAIIFILGGLLDIANGLVPYVHVDVLYLIGLSLPTTYLFCRFSTRSLQLFIVGLLCITPFLQSYFNYRIEMEPLATESGLALIQNLLTEIPRRYLIDGWFPLIPWLSLALFGALLGKYRYAAHSITTFTPVSYRITAAALIITGTVIWKLLPGDQVIRDGYIELFYPPMPGFMLFTMGFVLALIIFVDYMKTFPLWKLFLPLGEASLFMYLFHLLIITHILLPNPAIDYGMRYIAYFLLLTSTMIGIGFGLRQLRTYPFYRRLPSTIRMVLGG